MADKDPESTPEGDNADAEAKPAKSDDKPKGDDKKPARSGAKKSIDMGTSLKDVVKTSTSGARPAAKPAAKADAKAATATDGPKSVNVGGESFVDRVLPHMKKIVVTILVITVVLTGVFGYRSYQETKKEKATDKVVEALDVAERPIRPAGLPADPKNKDKSFGDAKERANNVLDAIAKSDAQVGHDVRGNLLVEAGRLDEAITEFKLGQDAPTIEGVLCREGIGLALEAKASAEKDSGARQKGLEDALNAFKTMQPEETGPRRAYALYHQGRILQLLGKIPDAKAAYEKAKELAKGTDLQPDERELMTNPRLPRLIDSRLDALGAS
jgi:predicted negative regulator of RcsB-dependent stress response